MLRHRHGVASAALDPDGSLVVTRSTDGSVRVFETRGGRLVRRLQHAGHVDVAIFSPDGKLIVTGSRDNVVRVWSARTGALVHELTAHRKGRILAASVDATNTYVAAGSTTGEARVWSLPTGDTATVLLGHTTAVTGVAFSPGGDSSSRPARTRPHASTSPTRDCSARCWPATRIPSRPRRSTPTAAAS